jgi:hypothetical protein
LEVEAKIFAKFDLNIANQISLMNIDVMRFITMNFSRERGRYFYDGGKRLKISEQDKQELLSPKSTTYRYYAIDERRRHFERIHKEYETPSTYPSITYHDKEADNSLILQPISHYHHAYYTSNIDYSFNERFVIQNNQFEDGYRDVCINALDNLISRYSRFFFVYLSGDKYEFRFSETKLRKFLRIENKYKKRNAIHGILECVQNEFKKLDIEFNYSYCTEAEWKKHKQSQDGPLGQLPATELRKENKKNKVFTKNFYFRAKGMEKYRVPRGVESIFSRDIAENRQYGIVRTHLNRELKMTDKYISEKWEYIKRYIDEFGAKALMDFAGMKMKEMAKQRKTPRNPKSVLMSIIVNKVKDLDTIGRGESTLFSVPNNTEHYDPRGKSIDEIVKEYQARYGHPPDSS